MLNKLTRHFDYRERRCYPNIMFGGGECDLLVVSPSGYATEYEVKLTLADWRSDVNKPKWRAKDRKHVTSFYYVVPVQLIAQQHLVEMQSGAGLLSWDGDRFDTHVEARRTPYKLTMDQRRVLDNSMYYRFWQQRLGR